MTDTRISHQHRQLNVLLVGDTCTDEYQYGAVDRINPEAPVPIISYKYTETRPGMSGNVERNLQALGCNVISYLGTPSTKTRVIDTRSRQHIVRIDQDVVSNPVKPEYHNDIDIVVVSDYNKGAVTYETIETLLSMYDVPIIVDTKKRDLKRLGRCIVKINEPEYNQLETKSEYLIVTHGKNPVEFQGLEFNVPAREVVDVCGAGDTFLSAFAYMFAHYYNFEMAIKFAICASCVTIGHVGVYAPTLEEINESC